MAKLQALLETDAGIFTTARLNELGDRGLSPLHFVVRRGSWQCAKLLLAYGADPDIQSSESDGSSTVFDDLASYVSYNDTARFARWYETSDDMLEVFEFNKLVKNYSTEYVTVVSAPHGKFPSTNGVSLAKLQKGCLDDVDSGILPEIAFGEHLFFFHVHSTNVSESHSYIFLSKSNHTTK